MARRWILRPRAQLLRPQLGQWGLQHFDLRQVSRSGAVFDFDKFRWLAGEYLRLAERYARDA